jgi:AcrR family transcriptional regulator
MGKPIKKLTSREQQAVERRKQLLEAATELYAAQGYHGTPVREINRRIGMADGLLYHYFPGGKLEILQTIVREARDRRLEKVTASIGLLDGDLPLMNTLLQFYRQMYVIMMEDRLVLKIHLRESELLEGDINKELSDMILERLDWLSSLLEAKAAAGEVRRMDYVMAARQLMSVWLMNVFQQLVGIRLVRTDQDDFLERMVNHLVELWKRE